MPTPLIRRLLPLILLAAAPLFAADKPQSPAQTNDKEPRNSFVGLRLDDGELIEKVGKDVTPPKSISTPEPNYSAQARRLDVQGVIVLEIAIDSSGRVKKAHALRSLEKTIDDEAIKAAMQWRFKPATKDGKPLAVAILVEVDFHIYD